MLVPVLSPDGQWTWAKAGEVYFGEGWIDGRGSALLQEAYGRRPNGRLVPWSQFCTEAEKFCEPDREWWQTRLQEISVATYPRILKRPLKAGIADIGQWYSAARTDVTCPLPCPPEIWKQYLEKLSQRKVDLIQQPQPFYLRRSDLGRWP